MLETLEVIVLAIVFFCVAQVHSENSPLSYEWI